MIKSLKESAGRREALSNALGIERLEQLCSSYREHPNLFFRSGLQTLDPMHTIYLELEERFFGYGFNRQSLSDVYVFTETFECRWCAMDTRQTLFCAPELDEVKVPDYILEQVSGMAREKLE